MSYFYSPWRKKYVAKKNSADCPFCDRRKMDDQSVKYSNGTIVENSHYRWIVNFYPKFEGHTMIVPKKHVTTIGEEKIGAIKDREALITLAAKTLQSLYPTAGIEVFLQSGAGSEASITHLHWHVVPASSTDPLRSFDKLGHFYTIKKDQAKILVFPIKIRKARQSLLTALAKHLKRKR
jgi:diadenosine tetraphosphate (Ap4A) HIT family hydrolase